MIETHTDQFLQNLKKIIYTKNDFKNKIFPLKTYEGNWKLATQVPRNSWSLLCLSGMITYGPIFFLRTKLYGGSVRFFTILLLSLHFTSSSDILVQSRALELLHPFGGSNYSPTLILLFVSFIIDHQR